jgi:putative MATE family efflux protein
MNENERKDRTTGGGNGTGSSTGSDTGGDNSADSGMDTAPSATRISRMDRSRLLTGSIPGALLRLSLPVMATFLLQTLYSMADAFWLGKLGREAISAPGISFPILFFFVSLGAGFSVAGTALVAQYTGSGQREQANLAAGQTLIFLLMGAVIISMVGIIASGSILRLMQTPVDVFSNAHLYLRVLFAGIPFMAISFVYGGIMRGAGDAITPMIIDIVTNSLNILLDPFFIFGWGFFPRMEVAGAAAVTVSCRFLASAACVTLLITGARGLRVRWPQIRPRSGYLGRILRIGMPAAIGQSGASLGFMVTQGFVNSFGSAVVGAFTVAVRVIHLINVPGMGFSAGASALIGQNLGADQVKRAEKTVWWGVGMVAAFLAVGCSVLVFASEPIIRLFIADPEVIAEGIVLFRVISYSVFFFGIIMVVFGAFQGSGKTTPVMVLSLTRLWLLRIPLAYLFSFILAWGHLGIWWAMFISNVVISLSGLYWFSRGTWKQKVI